MRLLRNTVIMLVLLVMMLLWNRVVIFAEQSSVGDGVPDGYMLIEGDIIVPDNYFETQGRQAWRENSWWPNGIVPYVFDTSFTSQYRDSMLAAMAELEAVSRIDFVIRGSESDYIYIQLADVNNSAVGRQGGKQLVNIFNWNKRFIMVHELMHSLGFWHEQTRPSRDQFVTIQFDSIKFESRHNFDIHSDAGEWGYYDFASIMHYPECAFSICDCDTTSSTCCCENSGQGRTIIVKPEYSQYQSVIGNRDSLSNLDTLSVMFAYPPVPWWKFCSKDADGLFPDGTFGNPYHTFSEGETGTSPGGVLWILAPGVYSAQGLHKKPIIIKAPLGGVILSQ